MKRFFNPSIQSKTLSPEESHHGLRVLRVQPHEMIEVFDGQGNIAQCIITDTTSNLISYDITAIENILPTLPQIDLIVSLIKFPKIELILDQCTQIGLNSFIFITTEFSQFQLTDAQDKLPRWQKILVESCKQSHNSFVPTIKFQYFQKILDTSSDYSTRVFACSEDRLNSIQISTIPNLAKSKNIGCLIGPEGGLSQSEIKLLTDKKFTPVSLGTNILRTETACISALTQIQAS
jgi:16S rRNA (uracil1498-N3)-methyltransferase